MDGSVAAEVQTKPTLSSSLWIVLTPSVDHAAWLKALARAAAGSGREYIEVSALVEPLEKDSPPVLYVTHNSHFVGDADPSDVLVIMPQPETAAEMTSEMYDVQLPHSMVHASILLAEAATRGQRSRVLTAHQLSRNPGKVELFPGVVVDVPMAELGKARPEIATALGIYRNGFPQAGASVAWAPGLFTYDLKSCIEGSTVGDLDITGRARTLLYGPYLALPPGQWRAKMRFAVDGAAAKQTLRFDWGLATDHVDRLVTPDHAGIYEVELDHTVATVDYWQFRIVLTQGTFDGRLIFQGGTVTRLGAVEAASA